MNWLDSFYWNCVTLIEYIGNITNIGYELTNIFIFAILQPGLILLFFVLWRIAKNKHQQLLSINVKKITSKATEFLWRLSRLLSVLIVFIEIFVVYSFYYNQFNNYYFKLIKIELSYFLILTIPVLVLIIFNFLVFGKVSIWIKKPS